MELFCRDINLYLLFYRVIAFDQFTTCTLQWAFGIKSSNLWCPLLIVSFSLKTFWIYYLTTFIVAITSPCLGSITLLVFPSINPYIQRRKMRDNFLIFIISLLLDARHWLIFFSTIKMFELCVSLNTMLGE